MYRTACLTLLVALGCAQSAAALTIVVGNHLLVPNLAGQVVSIFVQADGFEQVEVLNFRAQLGDGGPALGGSDITPSMVGDIDAPGAIFAPLHTPTNDLSVPPSYVELSTTTVSGTYTLAPGLNLVGTLTFDTTAFHDEFGMWPLLLTGTVGGNTNFGDGPNGVDVAVVNGSVGWVPEPGSFALAGLGLLGLAAWSWRRRS